MAMHNYHTTLSAILAEAGITHARDNMTETDGKRIWRDREGHVIGRYDVAEGWAKVREQE